jgi:hypothetical protein
MLLGEVVKEIVAPVGDEAGEVGAVFQLEGQDGRLMVGAEPLEIRHRTTLLAAGGHFGKIVLTADGS